MSLAAAMRRKPASYSLGLEVPRRAMNSSRTLAMRLSVSKEGSPPIASATTTGCTRASHTMRLRSSCMVNAPDVMKPTMRLYRSFSAASSRSASCSARISSSVFSGSAPDPSPGS